MPNDTVTLALSGEVTLGDFADAMARFNGLVAELSRTNAQGLTWVIADLEVSSAIATVKAISNSDVDIEAAARVARDFIGVGRALAHGRLADLPPKVAVHARNLSDLIDDRIKSIRFETAETDVIVRSASDGDLNIEAAQHAPPVAYGSIEGRVQTLTNRGSLRFTLYDTVNDKAVSCYLSTNDEESLRNVWGKMARVDGLIHRDPESDRPISIRQISNLKLLPETETWAYYRARAVRTLREEDPLPEVMIRRVRDAW